jgi:hypothetical protein
LLERSQDESIRRSVGIIALLVWPLYVDDLYLLVLWDERLDLLWVSNVLFFTIISAGTLCRLVCSRRISISELGLAAPVRVGSIILGLALAPVLGIVVIRGLGSVLGRLMPWRLFPGCAFPAGNTWRWILIVYPSVTGGYWRKRHIEGA